MMYTYRGDRWTDPQLKGVNCWAIKVPARPEQLDQRPKCVRGRNGNMLVVTSDGRRHVVLARQLRKQLHVSGRAAVMGGTT
jgi:hypothetical protein